MKCPRKHILQLILHEAEVKLLMVHVIKTVSKLVSSEIFKI